MTKFSDSTNYSRSCYAFNLRRAARVVSRRYEDHLRPLDMSAFQFTALTALTYQSGLSHLELADFFGMDPSTASRNIRAMERRSWVRYVSDPSDRRVKRVELSPKGRKALEQAIPLWERAQEETQSLVAEQDWESQRSWLEAISER
ncbi:MAG: MarR family transcriptional regulator [Pseudomonadota bacterium]